MKITVTGASGRMGHAVIRAITATSDAELSAAILREGSKSTGKDAGTVSGIEPLGIELSDNASDGIGNAQAVIDFTLPDAMLSYAEIAADKGVAFVSGTTGLDSAQEAKLKALAKTIPILWAPNMSLGVTLLMALTEKVAATLGEEYDIEILEMHHRHKVDAPSGTALGLGRAAAAGRDVALDDVACMSREGHTGLRPPGEIGFASVRGGDVVGDHTVLFASEGDRIELTHKASSRDIFAQGAVKATLWIQGQKPGLYSMRDVLGI